MSHCVQTWGMLQLATASGARPCPAGMRHTGITVFRRHKVLWGAIAVATVLAAQDVVFRTGVALVRVDAQVNGGTGGVNGLAKEDFEVRDNGELQHVLYCSQEMCIRDSTCAAWSWSRPRGCNMGSGKPCRSNILSWRTGWRSSELPAERAPRAAG